MKIEYFPETNSLYIELADRPGVIPEKFKKELFWISTIKDTPLALTSIKPPSTSA